MMLVSHTCSAASRSLWLSLSAPRMRARISRTSEKRIGEADDADQSQRQSYARQWDLSWDSPGGTGHPPGAALTCDFFRGGGSGP